MGLSLVEYIWRVRTQTLLYRWQSFVLKVERWTYFGKYCADFLPFCCNIFKVDPKPQDDLQKIIKKKKKSHGVCNLCKHFITKELGTTTFISIPYFIYCIFKVKWCRKKKVQKRIVDLKNEIIAYFKFRCQTVNYLRNIVKFWLFIIWSIFAACH